MNTTQNGFSPVQSELLFWEGHHMDFAVHVMHHVHNFHKPEWFSVAHVNPNIAVPFTAVHLPRSCNGPIDICRPLDSH